MFSVSSSCLRDLGWSRIIDALEARASTDAGRLAARALGFVHELDALHELLARVAELMTRLSQGARLPLDGAQDIRGAVERARRGAILDREPLLAITDTARAAARVRRALLQRDSPLTAVAEALPDLEALSTELGGTFDRAGNIRDDASPELAAARRRVGAFHRQAKRRLDQWLARPEAAELCQELYYTQREDRYVVPVTASFQAQVPGIIHGTSNTAQTVYVEPSEFIELNNQIKVAEATVEVETRRVLRARSAWVAEAAADLRLAFDTLVELDLLQARAQLAHELEGSIPRLSSDGEIHLRGARNPHLLLKGSAVVPNDIELSADKTFVVITGPNTGGKTVTLSTVGTFVLMLRAGIPIPAEPESVLAPFDGLFALVGDPQDIERDLSTFSGHLMALQEVLDEAHEGALVLLDEIIVGTEPSQGAALAIAVLESLAARGARGFVTTHYERLKTLAFEDPRFANAAVGIDPETLAPNFRLTGGAPGSSSPFEIARRLGMSERILIRARAIAGGHEGVALAVHRLQAARMDAERARVEAERARALAEARAAELEAERELLARRAQEELIDLQRDARGAVEEALAALREQTAELQKVSDQREVARRRRAVLQIADALPAPAPAAPERPEPERDGGPYDGGDLAREGLKIGARVWVRTFGKPGEVVGIGGAKITVAMGAFKVSLELADLGKLGGQAPRPKRPPRPRPTVAPRPDAGGAPTETEPGDIDTRVPAPRGPNNSVDLRGLRRDEVADLVEPLLDRAFRDNLGAIWVIHGHGTGALRDEVRQIIRGCSYVVAWRPGQRHEGGDGVTIAWVASHY